MTLVYATIPLFGRGEVCSGKSSCSGLEHLSSFGIKAWAFSQLTVWRIASAPLSTAGVSSAIQKMGEIYRDGRGVPADPVTAYMWFAIGAKMGAPDSEGSLAAMAIARGHGYAALVLNRSRIRDAARS